MRAIALLLLALALTSAELEQITLTDGRRLVGYYDEAAGKLTVEGPPKVVLSVAAAQIASRAAYVRPEETDPAKRDAASLVRLEAERDAAVAEATRLRSFAATRSGKDAEVATAQAAAQEDAAKALDQKIAAIRERSKPAEPLISDAPVPRAAPATRQSQGRQEAQKAIAEAYATRDKASAMLFDALVNLVKSMDLEPKPIPTLGPDPRESERDTHMKLTLENEKRSKLKGLLVSAEKAQFITQKEKWSAEVIEILDIPNESEARRIEREEFLRQGRNRAERQPKAK